MVTLYNVNRKELLCLLIASCIVTNFAFLSSAPSLARHAVLFIFKSQQQPLDVQTTTSGNNANGDSNFLRNCQVDLTIKNLRDELPRLLIKPLTEQDVEVVYTNDVTLTGPSGEELAYGQEELVSLSSTLVAATAAAGQANQFASSFASAARKSNTSLTNDIVDCKMAMDINLQTLRVEWKVDLPIANRASKLVGLSDLVLNDDGQVCEHKVLSVSLDGQTISAVGETLATLRRAVRTFGDSPLLTGLRDSPFTANILSDLRNGLLQQQEAKVGNETLALPPLYVTDTVSLAFEASSKSNMTLIDQYPTVLPGSSRWSAFASSRQALAKFTQHGLQILSGKTGGSREEFEQLFAPNATLVGVDGTTILAKGGDRIANLYRTMASLRKGTSDDWSIAQVSTDYKSRSVVVTWMATSPIRVEGRDRFRLCESTDGEPAIETIEQLELKISGNRVNDPEWFRTFLTAIESGRGNIGVDMVVDLLQQAGGIQAPSKPKSAALKGPPKLNLEAAASVYGVLCALHRDLPTLVDPNPQSPPAAEYVAENIELRGYLDELLAKGSAAYSQVANVLTASLRTALLTGRVTAESAASPTIEFTADGSIRVSLFVNLKVKVTPGDSDMGVPLNLKLVSEYKVNSDGKIKEHKLIESRVNGQLTPGDVMSRWIKGSTSNDFEPSLSFTDVLSWARTFSGSNSKRS